MRSVFLSAALVLAGCGTQSVSHSSSITEPGYEGHKYYVGFGDTLTGSMGNEVKYDVKHTHDLFSSQYGGDYVGGDRISSYSALKTKWREVGQEIGFADMYLQYSSGHGSETGLAFGPSYDDIRDNALSYTRAREIVIFTMACLSGNLVNSFNEKKSVWQNWQDEGKTLFVMASSRDDENSSTGPGIDPEEANGPNGSAGSAFGHALWKAIIGHADKEKGNNDGKTTLKELIAYVVPKTEEVGGHTPVFTGAYDPELVIALVPPRDLVDRLEAEGGTKDMSDKKVMELIKQLQ